MTRDAAPSERIVAPTNRRDAFDLGRRELDGPRPLVGHLSLQALLAGDPAPDAQLLVVDAGEGSEEAAALVAAHDGAWNLVVVAAAPADVATGQVGAFAGLGRPFIAPRLALLAARGDGDAVDEVLLRWRLWNDGCVVVGLGVEDAAVALPPATRLRADRVPVPPFRGPDVTEATVPTLSIVVHGGEHLDVLDTIPQSVARPTEVLVVGERHPRTGRIRRTEDPHHALFEARGAAVVFVHADAVVDRESWARLLRRLDDERVEVVRSAYVTLSGPVRSERGMSAVDAVLGAPGFAGARTRVLRKQRGVPFGELWREVVERERSMVVLDPPVVVDVDVPRSALPPVGALGALVGDAAAVAVGGLRDRAKDAVRGQAAAGGAAPSGQRASVGLIGFSGYENFGDELVLRAACELLDGVVVLPGGQGSHGTVLGGGTLLNADRFYQRVADRVDAPGLARLVLGTGVVSPEVKGWSEDLDPWRPFLAAGPVGLRGPDSVAHLRAWGFQGEVEVLGDPALAVEVAAEPRPGLVVLAPIGASSVGQVAADEERQQVALLARAAGRWLADGREVALLSAHPGDDRIVVGLLRALGRADLEVCHAGRDLDAGLALLAAADVVVGARLHALVAAAAAGTPFVGLAYRPKVLDFARSVDAGQHARAIPAWTDDALLDTAERVGTAAVREAVAARVASHRDALRRRAAGFVASLDGVSG